MNINKKLNEYFNLKGYDVSVEESRGEINFKIKYICFFEEREKVYSFYMVLNNDDK